MKKTVKASCSVIMSVCLVICMLYFSVIMFAFNHNFFKTEYIKNNTYSEVKISEAELNKVTSHLIKYLKGKENSLNINVVVNGESRLFFSEREILHMLDVNKIFLNFKKMFYISLLLLIASLIYLITNNAEKLIGMALHITIIIVFIVVFLIAVTCAINFDQVFTLFHKLFFQNDLWLLDPSVDLLINIVPEQFFIDIAIYIGIAFVTMSALVTSGGIALIKNKNK